MKNKTFVILKSGMLQQLREKSQLVGRMILFSVVIYLFHQIFQSVNAESSRLWYYAMCQMIILSSSTVAFQISQDIQSGEIVNFLLRPIHYLYFRCVEAMGASLTRYLMLLPVYLALQLLFAPHFSPLIFLSGIFFGMVAIFLYTLITILIALLSFTVKEIKPFFYLNLTATFCFGGLIVPLDDYSSMMQIISYCTPYPWILCWPAKWMIQAPASLASALLGWSCWFTVLYLLINCIYKRCIRLFVAEGG